MLVNIFFQNQLNFLYRHIFALRFFHQIWNISPLTGELWLVDKQGKVVLHQNYRFHKWGNWLSAKIGFCKTEEMKIFGVLFSDRL